MACKGLCSDTCGAIEMGPHEQRRMREAGATVPRLADLKMSISRGETTDPTCPALKDGQCSIYESRPMLCRIYYADNEKPCPHGCRPIDGAKFLPYAEARALLDAAIKLGTAEEPIPLQVIEAKLADPVVIAKLRKFAERQMPSTIRHRVEW